MKSLYLKNEDKSENEIPLIRQDLHGIVDLSTCFPCSFT